MGFLGAERTASGGEVILCSRHQSKENLPDERRGTVTGWVLVLSA